jgi:hypothetical protein
MARRFAAEGDEKKENGGEEDEYGVRSAKGSVEFSDILRYK